MTNEIRCLGGLSRFRREHEDDKCITVLSVEVQFRAGCQSFHDRRDRLQKPQMQFMKRKRRVDQKNSRWLLRRVNKQSTGATQAEWPSNDPPDCGKRGSHSRRAKRSAWTAPNQTEPSVARTTVFREELIPISDTFQSARLSDCRVQFLANKLTFLSGPKPRRRLRPGSSPCFAAQPQLPLSQKTMQARHQTKVLIATLVWVLFRHSHREDGQLVAACG